MPADASSPRPLPGRIVVLSGGVGGARFLQGLLRLVAGCGAQDTTRVDVVTNTGDDIWVHGLKVCPDLDTVMYTLGEGIDTGRGWGRTGETWNAKDELAAYGVEPTWFGLGDKDIATHLVRTQMLEAGYPLSAVTEALCRRWLTPAYGEGVRLLPMTDDRTETHVVITDPADGERRAVHFQEYWIRHRAEVPAHDVVVIGLDRAAPGPGVLDAVEQADVVVLPPSNPVVSVGPILGVPGLRDALRRTSAPVVGVSGIVGGDHVRGMARQLLEAQGVEVSAAGVAEHYGARSGDGVLDGWLVADVDAALVERVEAAGIRCRAVPLMMTDHDATAAMAAAALDLVLPGPEPVPRLALDAPDGIGEIGTGTDLVALVAGALPDLVDGDVVVVTSKVVSKAEGRAVAGTRDDALPGETVRLVARRGGTRIVVNHLGLTMAAAGIDASNVEPGTVLLLPRDPDGTARRLRTGLHERTGANVAVLVSDTAGRAWRHGQTDLAIGAAGIVVLDDHAGRVDGYGNALAVTAPAVADEVAAAAELASGKLGGRPVVRVRGLADRVLPAGEHGPGAASLVRGVAEDMFALGSREAVLAALAGREPAAFGAPVGVEELLSSLADLGLVARVDGPGAAADVPDEVTALRLALATHALGWVVEHTPGSRVAGLLPRTP